MVKFSSISFLFIGYIAMIQCAPLDPLGGGGGGKANGGLGVGNLLGATGKVTGHADGLLKTNPPPPHANGGAHGAAEGHANAFGGLIKVDGSIQGGAGGSAGQK